MVHEPETAAATLQGEHAVRLSSENAANAASLGSAEKAGPAPGPPPAPTRAWQWILIYPALAISLLTALPKWADTALAAVHNVQNRSFSEAKLQSDLWAKNLPCTAFPLNYARTDANVALDATICDSGDIFVRASTSDHHSHFYWVPVDRIIGKEVHKPSLLSSADAAEAPLGGAKLSGAVTTESDNRANLLVRVQAVICQHLVDARHVVRRISTPQGCMDQIVDTYTGQVVSVRPAPCTPQC
jgi:hypothetical protein